MMFKINHSHQKKKSIKMERLVEVESVSFEEDNSEVSLRPSNWDDYIGQEKIKKNLGNFINFPNLLKVFLFSYVPLLLIVRFKFCFQRLFDYIRY